MGEEITTLMQTVNEGFDKLHTKIDNKVDGLRKDFFQHQAACGRRFQEIETEVRVKTAINDVMKQVEEKKPDYWKYFMRAAIPIITGGVLLVLWRLFIGHIDLIGR